MSLGMCKAKTTMLAHLNIMHFNKFLGGDDMHWSTIPVNDDTSGIFFEEQACDVIQENISHRFMCFHTWVPDTSSVWGSFGKCGLVG